jgi:hypothetical protein
VNPPGDLVRVVPKYGQAGISAGGQLQKPLVRNLATFEELRVAQDQSERMRARGELRRKRNWSRASNRRLWTILANTVRLHLDNQSRPGESCFYYA